MRRLVVLLVATAMSLAFAHEADAGRFGIKAGANVTSLDFKDGSPLTLGYAAGVTWQWNLPVGFAIQPDLLYHVTANALSDVDTEVLKLGYVELPVNIQWGLRFAQKNVRLFAQASPFVGYAVNAKNIGNVVAGSGVQTSGIDKWTNINRFSYGAGLGVGLQLWFLQVTAQYNWNFGGLSNIKDASLSDFNKSNSNGCTLAVALMFGGKKNK